MMTWQCDLWPLCTLGLSKVTSFSQEPSLRAAQGQRSECPLESTVSKDLGQPFQAAACVRHQGACLIIFYYVPDIMIYLMLDSLKNFMDTLDLFFGMQLNSLTIV
jgi:hypothetical protein